MGTAKWNEQCNKLEAYLHGIISATRRRITQLILRWGDGCLDSVWLSETALPNLTGSLVWSRSGFKRFSRGGGGQSQSMSPCSHKGCTTSKIEDCACNPGS